MRTLLIPAVLLLTPTVLRAQLPPVTPAECQAQADSLLAGDRTGRTWPRLAECGAVGAAALVTAIRNARTETDAEYLLLLLGTASQLRSSDIIRESAALVRNASGSSPARVMATFVALAQYRASIAVDHRRVTWTQLLTQPSGETCPIAFPAGGTYTSIASTPTPAEVEIAAEAFHVVAGDASAPPVVRDLARCARTVMLVDVPHVVNPQLVQLIYVCGTRFKIQNDNKVPVEVTYRVVGTSEQGAATIAAAEGANSGEFLLETHHAGTIELLHRGIVIRTTANGGTTCPP